MRIGFFLRNLDEEFQITVFRGVSAQARARGVHLVCVQGETVNDPQIGSGRPFGLASQVSFDGLLVLSPVIADSGDPAPGLSFDSLPPGCPVVSVGMKLPGRVSLAVPSRGSLTRVLEHLILDHGYRRFLFLGGPEHHRDSRERESVFRRTLRTYAPSCPGLESRIEYGGFTEYGAIQVLRGYLDGPPFDAVVAANDNMALGALKVLRLEADGRWAGCAVTGFDDTPQASLGFPPLTSVHQPLEELGARALDTVADWAVGRKVPVYRAIASWPVIRESCGCRPPVQDRVPDVRGLTDRWEEARRQAVAAEQWLRSSNFLGRDLAAAGDRETVWAHLDHYLGTLGIGEFSLLEVPGEPDPDQPGSRLVFGRRAGGRMALPPGGQDLGIADLLDALTRDAPAPLNLTVAHLRSGMVPLGLAVYSAAVGIHPHLSAILPHVANALKRLTDLELQRSRNRLLEAEVLQISEFERRRFGLDLHDDICQRLAGVSLYLGGFRHLPPSDPAAVLEEVRSLVDETLQLTRQYAHASFPIDLDRRGLDAVLGTLCGTVAAQARVSCRYSGDWGPADLDSHEALNVYRIVQEALHNAVKHARATVLEVEVSLVPGGWTLRVSDNGRGLSPGVRAPGGLGLRSMAYRADQMGARLDLGPRPGGGTVVTLTRTAP